MNKLWKTLADKWVEYLLEILVITLGVVGAFVLNSWNEGVKFRREQQEIIRNLNEEFKTNLESLDDQMFRLNRKINASILIYELIDPAKAIPDAIDLDTLARRLYDNPTWNPSTYVLTDLRNSGQLKSLENEQLKRLLHEWEQHYENLREWYLLETAQYNKLMSVISEYGSARNMLFKSRFGPSPFSLTNQEMIQSAVFENHLSHNLMISGGLQNIYETQTVQLINRIIEETELTD